MSDAAGATLRIDLAALRRNYRTLRRVSGGADVAGVVKADAYGLGLAPVAQALLREGCGVFFVAHLSEAETLRPLAAHAAIYVLNGLWPGQAPRFFASRLRPVLGSVAEIAEWAACCRGAQHSGEAAIHVDTGMNRLGLDLAEAAQIAEPGIGALAFTPTLIMSHFACADVPGHALTHRQIERFAAIRPLFAGVPASFANSAGVFLKEQPHYELVRPGIALYGGAFGAATTLEPVVALSAPVIALREVREGDTVGYGATWRAPRPSRIATVSVGYADGYPRAASPRGSVQVNDTLCPIAGRISMDLMAIDVTAAGAVERGTPVTLLDTQLRVDDVADAAATIGYEILTSLGARYARDYEGG